MRRFFWAVAALLLVLQFFGGSNQAFAAENLYICRPCSGDFVAVAERVVGELGLDERVEVKTTGCLGYCAAPAVVRFRDEVYAGMDEERLRMMLEAILVQGF